MAQENREFEVTCPCCGARLKIDAGLGKVIAHQAPEKHKQVPELDRATALLQKEAARREAHFRESAEEAKVRSQLLERKFEEALKKTKDEPVEAPQHDIDLD